MEALPEVFHFLFPTAEKPRGLTARRQQCDPTHCRRAFLRRRIINPAATPEAASCGFRLSKYPNRENPRRFQQTLQRENNLFVSPSFLKTHHSP